MEDKLGKVGDSNEVSDDLESVSEDSLEDTFDDEVVQLPGHENGLQCEELLTESEIEELIAELLEVESKAAEAQESLEKESLEKVEHEVREELAQTLQGDDLEQAVAEEMTTFKEEWEAVLDELEAESAVLSEQLDGAGIDLASIYKWIESQAPSGCSTEAWRKRTHWVGSNITSDAAESIADADKQLQTIRPIRRRHGKILEEGASGYLAKKLVTTDEGVAEYSDSDWSSFNKLFSGHTSEEMVSFGSKQWVSVYLASTPQQAANMGVKFPGVDEVEEIDELDCSSSDPFLADAFANERELDLSEEQKRNYKKVKEEDDANVDKRLHIQLKRRRQRKIRKQELNGKVIAADELVSSGTSADGHRGKADDAASIENGVHPSQNEPAGALDGSQSLTNTLREKQVLASSIPCSDDASMSKSLQDGEEVENENRRHQISNSDSEMDSVTYVDRQPIVQENGGHSVGVPANLDKIEDFRCTACDKLLIEAHRHPILRVIVCWECRCAVESRMNQDPDCLECYCGWCGRRNKLINCKSCETFFCVYCIKRNIGEKCWSELELHGWQCCCCSPDVLQRFASDYEKAFAHGNLEVSDSESDSDHSEEKVDISISSRKRRKRTIRRIIDDAELGEETRKKIAIEKERQERLKSLQAQLSRGSMMMDAVSCDGSLPEGATSEVLGDASTGFIVNVRRESGEAAARIAPSISAKLKAHQVAGIRFMWENVIESVSKVKAGDKGLGCILAHTMGLGKTLQVIAFLYTAMKSVDLGLKSALIVAPVNVLHNWRQEFVKWQPSEYKPFRIFMLEDVSRERRSNLIKKWRIKGGVFLIGYTAFRDLSLGKNVKDRRTAQEISCDLQEGPDILVCDEAHIIKNNGADTTQALKQVKCQRRIALTGSPLQNNLMEYYCMVDFVREGFLGSSHEFRNRFQNPIENGQHTNSTAVDVRIMNQRSHILYEQLKGFVQRMGLSVVKKDLPPKTVFVVAVKLSSLQRKLYKRFLDAHGFTKDKAVCEGMRRKSFFAGYQALAQICNHPWILQLMKEREYARREDVEHYLADDISSDENADFNVVSEDKVRHKVESMHRRNDHLFHEGWWNDLLNKDNYQEVNYSGKMILLLDILTMCSNLGDKALVFSQSIPTLDLIEFYLSKLVRPGKKGKQWKPGKDWYRIDGKTKGSERQKMVELFNNRQNKRVKCTLISTKAGSLGINLYAANRVIIVDGSWNPTHDLQAIYRAWRYGQMKPVYAYRLVAHGTMEEKIYKRQVTKEGLAARVVDRQQVYRTISKEEMLHLFEFGDDEDLDTLPGLEESSGHLTSKLSGKVALKKGLSVSLKNHSSDRLMEVLLSRHHPRWITNVHEHETLLQENEEEKLTKEEQDMAWEGYRRSMEWEEVHRVPVDESTFNQNETTTCMSHRGQDTHFHSDVQLNSGDPNSRDPLAHNDGGISRAMARLSRRMSVRKCTGISHLMTLKIQGTKSRCSTVCGECAREIGWEDFS